MAEIKKSGSKLGEIMPVFSAGIIALAALLSYAAPQSPAGFDCKDSSACFISKLSDCGKATVIIKESGVEGKLTIVGSSAGAPKRCDVKAQIIDYSRPSGISDKQWEQAYALKPLAKTMQMTCSISEADARQLDMNRKNATLAKKVFSGCSGSLKDAVEGIIGAGKRNKSG